MKRLVLLGGGHAHLFVLEAFAREQPDAVVSLITPDALTPYSGMMPGVIAGHYDYRQACIDLAPLAARAGCALRLDAAVSLDAGQRQIRLASGEVIDYDMLSIDTGSTPRIPDLPGADTCAHPVKPIGQLLESWHTARAARSAAVVGAGAAGVEIIMALHHRQPRMRCTLIDRAPHILDGLSVRLQRRVMIELARQRIDVVTDARVSGVDGDALNLGDGRSIPSQFTVWATGAAPPAWLRGSGLANDERGFIATGPTLQSLSHPEVFAAGDVATMIDSPRPKSGVFAVRAGPPLAANLLRAARGDTLQLWTPQTQALLLLACGRRHAIASRGGWSLQGDWVWRWKDRIDRAFMRRFGG
ncbi:FAD-dependent oxidoreductase [Methyloversatilis sp. XJ19-49]|uniref:FAD-dependent oxidoreductase n=1 Tax=Methyloversatilis sp. XJ19-49 TaxID=2963429 RepID=UPI00211C051E|nr:FAD-dependent oxidoreductase [Methyloversatilis sp. XJ19-49]MCQ9376560.1 FAD-dependent oxidoreductase [Methyloversatilis sp. XJ19-49]